MHNHGKCLKKIKRSFAIALCVSFTTGLVLCKTNLIVSEEKIIPEQSVQVISVETPTVKAGVSIKFNAIRKLGVPYTDENLEIDLINKNKNEVAENSLSNNNAEESISTESETTEVQRENKHYYMLVDGYQSNLPVEYQDYLWELCKQYDVTEHYELFIAQMYRETTFRPSLISDTNDYGIMQINICNHDWLREKLGITDFLDPYQNMKCGIHIMSGYLHKYDDVQKALVCYNMGESKVKKGIYSSRYSREIVELLDCLVEIDD